MLPAMTQPPFSKSLSLVRTMLVLFGRGLPPGRLSRVFLPITTVFPVVFSLKYFKSPGIWQRSFPPFPMAQFLSAALLSSSFSSYLKSDSYRYIEYLRIFLIIFYHHIVYSKIVKVFYLRIEPELRGRILRS